MLDEVRDLRSKESKAALGRLANHIGRSAAQPQNRTLYDAQDQIGLRKDSLIVYVEARLQQKTNRQNHFTILCRLT